MKRLIVLYGVYRQIRSLSTDLLSGFQAALLWSLAQAIGKQAVTGWKDVGVSLEFESQLCHFDFPRIPGTGEPGGLRSLGLHRVGHD